jgi:HEAT repeat protein
VETRTHLKIDVNLEEFPDIIVDFIPDLIDKKNYKRRVAARKSLVALGKDILPYLYKLLTSKDFLLRREAGKIIELIPDKRSIPILLNLLSEDEDSGIRWIASEGLVKIGRDCIIPLLKALVKCNSTYYIEKGAHHVFNALFTPDEKEELKQLILSLHNNLDFESIASVEAAKALRTVFNPKKKLLTTHTVPE